jgi:sodium/hydrogen antiporter
VFVCACTLRAAERNHTYHHVLHTFVEQIERLLTVVVLILLGGAVARGLFAQLGWVDVLVALAFLLLIRPLSGWVGLAGGTTGPRERGVISFFGVRGVGSLYYAAYAFQQGDFGDEARRLWGIVGLVVVLSILIHWITATPAMRALDDARRRAAGRPDGDHDDPEVARTRV